MIEWWMVPRGGGGEGGLGPHIINGGVKGPYISRLYKGGYRALHIQVIHVQGGLGAPHIQVIQGGLGAQISR